MVNKVALGILAVIVLTAMTVGGLVGLQLGGDSLGGAPVGQGTPSPTPTATPSPTPTSTATRSLKQQCSRLSRVNRTDKPY